MPWSWWVECSRSNVHADVAHDKSVALGYAGSKARSGGRAPRSRRRIGRASAGASAVGPGAGRWFHDHFGAGRRVTGRELRCVTQFFCTWPAWRRSRVVLALPDRTPLSAMAVVDTTLRGLAGAHAR